MTWEEASDHCQSEGSQLLSIHSSSEAAEIVKNARQYGSLVGIYIGLHIEVGTH